MTGAERRLAAFALVVLEALRTREEALRVPFMGTDITRIVAMLDLPSWVTAGHGPVLLDLLVEQGRIERVALEDLERFAGRGLPLHVYWPADPTGWRVVGGAARDRPRGKPARGPS